MGGYGGEGSHRRRNDVIVYDTIKGEWTVGPPAGGEGCGAEVGSSGVAAAAAAGLGAVPMARMGHAAAPVGGELWGP